MSLRIKYQARRAAAAAGLRFYDWRGDPLAKLMRPAGRRDPYPTYSEVRRTPVANSSFGSVVTGSHDQVAAVLKDPRFSSSPVHSPSYRPPEYPHGDPRREVFDDEDLLLFMDPPDHTRIRRLVGATFSPRAVNALGPWVREQAEALVAGLDPGGFDLVDDVAFPLPFAVICHLLGIPAPDRDRFRRWGNAVAAGFDPVLVADPDSPLSYAQVEVTEYFRDLVAARRDDPGDDLLSALILAEAEGERLNADELVSTCFLILVAGFETTVNLIGNGTVALLDHPDQWRRLRAERALVPGAVEEMLRYDSPVQMTSRRAVEDLQLAGVDVPRGRDVILLLGGANRDPAVFDDPDTFDVTRANASAHLSFSTGIHHCLGAALARMEGRMVFEALLGRFDRLEPAGPLVRRPTILLRGYDHVPLRGVEVRGEYGRTN